MKAWLTWHKPFLSFIEAYCPNCGEFMRDNGESFHKCRHGCNKRFIILESIE